MKKRLTKNLLITLTLLTVLGCDSQVVNKRSVSNATQDSSDSTTEIISSESVKDDIYLAPSEIAVKRYKPINLVAKIITRTLNVPTEEREWSRLAKKSTGTLSFLATNAVTTTSRPVDGVSLAWFKEIRQYAGLKCQAAINREANDPTNEENVIIKSNNLPTEADLNALPLKALRLEGIESGIHEIAKTYAPVIKQISDKQTAEPGTAAYLNAMKNAYRLYCIAVLTDPLVIFY